MADLKKKKTKRRKKIKKKTGISIKDRIDIGTKEITKDLIAGAMKHTAKTPTAYTKAILETTEKGRKGVEKTRDALIYTPSAAKQLIDGAKRVVVGSPAYRSISKSLNEKTGAEKPTKRKKVFKKKNEKPRTDILRRY